MDLNEKTIEPQPASQDSTACAGSWFGELVQSEFEIDFLERIVARRPDDVRLLRLLGEGYARAARFDQALAVDRRLVAIVPNDPIVVYNLACSLSMNAAAESALVELERALELGYHDFAHLEVDPDLELIRQLPQFAELLRKYVVTSA